MVPIATGRPRAKPLSNERWLEHASALMPWAISILFHVGLLLILLFVIMIPARGPQQPRDIGGGHVMMLMPPRTPPVERKRREREEEDKDGGPRKIRADITVAPPVIGADPGRLEAGVLEVPPGPRGGDGGFDVGSIGTVSFIDITSPARKVVYVVDKSGSMVRSFPYVKAALIRSINGLVPTQHYHVIFFADGKPFELALDGRVGLQRATGRNKRATYLWIKPKIAQSHGQGTDPRKSMVRAFKAAGGPPDVIYLLTDGLFPEETRELIARLNRDRKVKVHIMAFAEGDAPRLLQQIAEDNGGDFSLLTEEDLAGVH